MNPLRRRDDSDIATSLIYAVPSYSSWSKTICSLKMGITRIKWTPNILLPPFKGEHLEQTCSDKSPCTYHSPLKGKPLDSPHGWLKHHIRPGYSHYDWVQCSGRVHRKNQVL
jgi:hypothetical protein